MCVSPRKEIKVTDHTRKKVISVAELEPTFLTRVGSGSTQDHINQNYWHYVHCTMYNVHCTHYKVSWLCGLCGCSTFIPIWYQPTLHRIGRILRWISGIRYWIVNTAVGWEGGNVDWKNWNVDLGERKRSKLHDNRANTT